MALTLIKALLNEPLYCSNEHAQTIMSILERHEEGFNLSEQEINAIEENKYEHSLVAGLGPPVRNERGDMLFYGTTAVVHVLGSMFRRGDWMTNMCGMVSTSRMVSLVSQAADNPDVTQIVLEIDSPGGMVGGTYELWQAIMSAKKKKPVYALVNDAFSAAYFVASAATKIYLTSPSSGAGNIGVATQHINMAEYYAKQGLEVTEVASEGKRTVSLVKPLNEESLAILQSLVDSHYSVFLEAVAEGRGKTKEYVHENWAKGRIFIGQDALDLGMADGYSSLEEIVKMSKNNTEPQQSMSNEQETSANTETAVTQNNDNEVLRSQLQQVEQKQKDLMSMFGNLQQATEMKNAGKLSPHAFATIFGTDTSNIEATVTAVQAFSSSHGDDSVKAALALVNAIGYKPTTMTETVADQFVLQRSPGSPERDEETKPSDIASSVVAGLNIEI